MRVHQAGQDHGIAKIDSLHAKRDFIPTANARDTLCLHKYGRRRETRSR
jgi:hypothetical protein